MITNIALQPLLKIADEDMMDKGLKVLEISHKSCIILNSVKSEIVFMPYIQCDSPTLT